MKKLNIITAWIAFRVKAKNSAGLESSFSNFSNWK